MAVFFSYSAKCELPVHHNAFYVDKRTDGHVPVHHNTSCLDSKKTYNHPIFVQVKFHKQTNNRKFILMERNNLSQKLITVFLSYCEKT